MAQESEGAAKRKIVKQFQDNKARLTALREQLHRWGETLRELGNLLQVNPYGVDDTEQMPTPEDILKVVQELKRTEANNGRLEDRLKEMGIQPF